MTTVAVLHPGRMGAAVGALLLHTGADVRWLPAGRGPGTRSRADAAGLAAADDLAGCDVVLSICPPAAAVDTARSVAGFGGLYVDATPSAPPRRHRCATWWSPAAAPSWTAGSSAGRRPGRAPGCTCRATGRATWPPCSTAPCSTPASSRVTAP